MPLLLHDSLKPPYSCSVQMELALMAEVLESAVEFVCQIIPLEIETSQITSVVSMVCADGVMLSL